MKINVIKSHHKYPKGEHDIDEGTGKYLVKMGVAEEPSEPEDDKYTVTFTPEKEPKEKKTIKAKKEKREIKTKVPIQKKK